MSQRFESRRHEIALEVGVELSMLISLFLNFQAESGKASSGGPYPYGLSLTKTVT